MGVEARNMLAEESRRTIADKGYVRQLISKWGEFLEGIPDRTEQQRYTLGVCALLMENEAQHLLGLNEDTRAVNVGSFTKFIFPILRRVFPNLIANEIVSVQPMTAPVGAVFYMDAVYGTTKGSTQAGSVFPRDFDRNYSSEYVSGEALVTGNGTDWGASGAKLALTLAFNPVRPLDTTRGFSVVIQEEDSTGAVVQSATDKGDGTFTFSTSGGSPTGTLNYSNGALTNFAFKNVPVSTNKVKAYYYYDGELNQKIPQVQLDVKKAPVEAQARRLKALWSAEAAEDLRAFHGIDAETEMVSMTAQNIALEIDREIVQDLFAAATGTTSTFDRVPPAGIPEIDHLRALITQISTVSNLIHKKTLRAPANFIVTSPEISALIAQLTTHADFRPMWNGGGDAYSAPDMPRSMTPQGSFGIYKTGTLMNKWMVYEDPYFTRDQMLIGLKGSSFLDAGYVWAPYIPLQVTPTFLDPSDFSFRKGLRTRYAKKVLRPEFYGSLRVLNL